jgi:outer membrane protein assembly factor BamE (lipoprotein component of BamABCDE complex)
MRRYIAAALLCLPAALVAQQAEHTISPGMTRAEVVAALGAPATQRTAA